jgi:hypothetical protein
MSRRSTRRRGRPRLDYTPVTIRVGTFNLHPQDDEDLIVFFRRIPPRQRVAAIKAALRAGGGIQSARQVVEEQYSDLDEAAGALF